MIAVIAASIQSFGLNMEHKFSHLKDFWRTAGRALSIMMIDRVKYVFEKKPRVGAKKKSWFSRLI